MSRRSGNAGRLCNRIQRCGGSVAILFLVIFQVEARAENDVVFNECTKHELGLNRPREPHALDRFSIGVEQG